MTPRVTLHGHGEPEPIGLEYIAGSLARAGFSASFRSRFELEVSRRGGARVASLLSGLTSEWSVTRQAAVDAKARGNAVVVGGYHVCGSPEDASSDLFDYVVMGEGEEVAPALVDDIVEGRPESQWGAKADGEQFPRGIRAPQVRDLDALPRPLRRQEFLGIYMLHDLMWPPPSAQRNPAIVLASRGCGYACDFCASATVWGHGLRRRSPEHVVGELRDLKARFGSDTVVFIDQSLGQDPEWTIELCRAIREADLGLHWYQQSNLIIEPRVIAALASAGCAKIGFGLETMSPRAIEMTKPQNPHDLSEINTVLDYCNSLGVFTKAYLMLGFPWETPGYIEEYAGYLQQLRANQIKLSFFTPFPGTKDWGRYRHQLVTRDWAHFDTVAMPVVGNPSIGVERYFAARSALFRTFYGSESYAEVTRLLLARYPQYAASYAEFLDYLQTFDMVSGEEKWLEWVRPTGDATDVAVISASELG